MNGGLPAIHLDASQQAAVNFKFAADILARRQALKSKGVSIRPTDLAFLSPHATSKLKQFGDYPTNLTPEAMPTCM
ncbi:MAG: hypothetical protein RL302_2185 [Pseudomonadota bacterium]